MIKTSQINQSIEINFQKELINTYKYMKNQNILLCNNRFAFN